MDPEKSLDQPLLSIKQLLKPPLTSFKPNPAVKLGCSMWSFCFSNAISVLVFDTHILNTKRVLKLVKDEICTTMYCVTLRRRFLCMFTVTAEKHNKAVPLFQFDWCSAPLVSCHVITSTTQINLIVQHSTYFWTGHL